MKTQVNRMTEGNPLKLIVVFGLPILMGNLFQQLYNLADSIIVGAYVGTNGLAAVGAVGSIQFFFFSFCLGLSGGIGIVIAQYFGAQDDMSVKKSIVNGAILSFVVSILMATLGVIGARLCLELMGTPEDVLVDAILYMRATCVGIVGISMYNTVSEMLRALGDSRTPLKFLIFSAVTNIILDILLIVKFDMGVFGAGVATATAQFLSAIGVTLYAICKNNYFEINRENLVVDRRIIKQCARTGMPIALQFSMIAVSCIGLQVVVNGFGATVVATNTIVAKVEQVIVPPFFSLTTALQAYTGQNIGAGNVERVRQGIRCGVGIMIAYTLFIVPVVFIFGDVIVGCFVSDPEVISLGAQALKITSSFYIFLGIIYITRGVLNGAGDSAFALMSGMMEVLGRVGFTKPLTMVSAIGVYGIWIASGMTWLFAGVLGVVRYKQGKWKQNAGRIIEGQK